MTDALVKEALLLILDEISVSRQSIPKLRELRRKISAEDKPVEQPEQVEPLCPT
jgi:hypothetical protein